MQGHHDAGNGRRRGSSAATRHGRISRHSLNGAKINMTTAVNALRQVMRSFRDLCDVYLVKPINRGQLLGHMKGYDLVG
jgi:hypothetical protein